MGINDGVDELEILEIIGEVSNGLIHLHLQEPPIAHRDIKVTSINIFIMPTVRECLKRK